MNNKKREEFAEKLLDTALAQYRGVEAPWGLEERILANLRERARTGPGTWSKFGSALAAMVTIAVLSQATMRPVSYPTEALLAAHEPESQNAGIMHQSVPDNDATPALTALAGTMRPAAARIASPRPLRKAADSSAPPVVQSAAQPAAQPAVKRADDDVRITDVHVSDLKMTEIAISGSGRDD
jgi:hypothetical protein